MKNHLKRIAAPRTWQINRKESAFIVRPNPGAHSFYLGLPLGVLLRDFLQKARTMIEVKKLLHQNEVLVDGRRRKDHRFIIGLFDVVSLPQLKEYYRIVLDKKGRLQSVPITAADANNKICKVIGKKVLPHEKVQLQFHDGKTILSAQPVRVGDSVLFRLPTFELQEIIPLQPGVLVFLSQGKHSGDLGTLKAVKGKESIYVQDGKEIETATAYLFAIGKKEAALQITAQKAKLK